LRANVGKAEVAIFRPGVSYDLTEEIRKNNWRSKSFSTLVRLKKNRSAFPD